MSNKKIVKGKCPNCGAKDSVSLYDFYIHGSRNPFATYIPVCDKCDNDEIEIRKINNRRYKIVGSTR